MRTVVDLRDREALVDHCREVIRGMADPLAARISGANVHVSRHVPDERIGWDTHVVTVDGFGVVGFTDGPVPESSDR